MGRLSPELSVLSFIIAYKKHCKHILANFQMSESEEDFSPNAHFPLETFLSPILWFFLSFLFPLLLLLTPCPRQRRGNKGLQSPSNGKTASESASLRVNKIYYTDRKSLQHLSHLMHRDRQRQRDAQHYVKTEVWSHWSGTSSNSPSQNERLAAMFWRWPCEVQH